MDNKEQNNSIVQKIVQAFAVPGRPQNVDLRKLQNYLDSNEGSNSILQHKMREFGDLKEISNEQFKAHFNPGIEKKEHFDQVFRIIDTDGSGYIARSEIIAANREYKLGLTESDIEKMIRFTSRDMQKVKKQDLYDFITKNE